MLKATKVDGVYTADPKKVPDATRYASITFDEAIAKNLQVMDATAFALCRDQNLPIKVFSIFKPGALKRVVHGRGRGHAGARLKFRRTFDAVPTESVRSMTMIMSTADIKKTAETKMGRSHRSRSRANCRRSAPAAPIRACWTRSTSTTTARRCR